MQHGSCMGSLISFSSHSQLPEKKFKVEPQTPQAQLRRGPPSSPGIGGSVGGVLSKKTCTRTFSGQSVYWFLHNQTREPGCTIGPFADMPLVYNWIGSLPSYVPSIPDMWRRRSSFGTWITAVSTEGTGSCGIAGEAGPPRKWTKSPRVATYFIKPQRFGLLRRSSSLFQKTLFLNFHVTLIFNWCFSKLSSRT